MMDRTCVLLASLMFAAAPQPAAAQCRLCDTPATEVEAQAAAAPPVRLEVEGAGVAVLASSLQGVAGAETRWNVRLRVSPAVPPGELLLILRAVFGDGKSVEVDGAITVVPGVAPKASESFPWLGVAVGVTLALALAVAALLLARRRRRSAW